MSTAKKIQFLQAPVASFICELFRFSTIKVRVLAPLFVFFSHCSPFSLIVELLFSNMHPSITIYFNSPIHIFLCRLPVVSHTAPAYPHAQEQTYCVPLSSDNIELGETNQQFSVGMDDVPETDNLKRLLLATFTIIYQCM